MNRDLLVTGGTGDLGRELVPLLVANGHSVRVLSRKTNPPVPPGVRTVQGDLVTGEGLAEALAGIDVLVHCATGARDTGARGLTYATSRKTDVEPTRRLLEMTTSKPHFFYISIVGVDKIPLGYYRAKLECEQLIERSGLPYTIFRTTQWHTLAWEFCTRLSRTPIVLLPKGVASQLLHVPEVAEKMAAHIERGPSQRVPDMAGPQRLEFSEIGASYLRATRKRRVVASVRFPGKTIKAFRNGYNCVPGQGEGKVTWDEWLARRVPGAA
jgi:uncharacterized protein YbjT (DUF2867 family)